jgi:phosphate transport system permease protein
MPQAPNEPADAPALNRRAFFSSDRVLKFLTTASALMILLMLAGLITVLTVASVPSFKAFGFSFVTSREWRPNELEQPKLDPNGKVMLDSDGEQITETLPAAFGALPVIYGTVVSSMISLVLAVPLSLGAALMLVRIARPMLAIPISFLIEVLAAIPSIAYGLWGLFVLCPFLQQHIEPQLNSLFASIPGLAALSLPGGGVTGRDMLCGGIILGIMIVPIITAISRDVLKNVPRIQLEGSIALGATWWQSSREMLTFSRSGLFGAAMLGLARAAGETMAITMVIGNNTQIKASPLAPAQTMSSLLANEFAEASTDLHRSALTEIALVLLLMSLLFNIVARYLVVGGKSRTALAH